MTDGTESGPFGRAAHMYRAAGWLGTLPLGDRPGRKYPPPSGFTGHGSPYPSGADVEAWLETHAGVNIGLRMPADVIGLDIDAGYSKVERDKVVDKRGEDTLAELEAKYGPLPATWVSSARPAPSGIRFYRVPEQLDGRPINWPGEAGKFIEIIQPGHRYAVAWPSTNPDAGDAPYEWHWQNETGTRRTAVDAEALPRPEALTALPEAWVRGLALPYERTEKADVGELAARQWWDQLRDGAPCPAMVTTVNRAVAALRDDAGSRHEVARDALAALVRMAGDGHRGGEQAVAHLAAAFEAAVGVERVRAGEWSRLLRGAVRLAVADHPDGPRQSCEHDAAVGVTGEQLVAMGFTVPAPAPAAMPTLGAVDLSMPPIPTAPPAGGASLNLPPEFWQARESLRRVQQAAHSRVRSADVVFAGLLCRLAALAPHTLRADTGISTPASLNLFAAIVGPSGAGKSSGLSVTRDLVKADRDLEEFPLGSGEGVAEAYMGEVDEGTGEMSRDGSEKTKRVRKQVRHNALFHADEGASLNKLIERSGSTVGETLRSGWSGEAIGQKNGKAETTRTINSRSYAMGLMIGYQPTTVLPLLADHEAGTPQRFLYVWAVDPTIPPRAQRVPWPGEMPNPFPASVPTNLPPPGTLVSAPPPGGEQFVTFDEAILDELYDQEHAKSTGTLPAGHWLLDEAGQLDPFRSQHPVLKVKVASLLALLESRRHVGAEDWRLAQIVLDTSDRVREYLQALARAAAGKARAVALAAEAEAEQYRAHARASVSASLDLTAERRLAVRVAVWVHEGGPLTIGALRKRAPSRDRPMVEAAIEIAIESGWLVAAADGHIHPGGSRPAG